MSEKCEHSTGTVVFTCDKFSIVHCDWGCGEYLIELNIGKHEVKTITTTELAAMQERIKELEAENTTMYDAIMEAADMGSLRCKVELQRIARNDAQK